MENERQEPLDYEKAKQKVKEQFSTGKSLYGKDGALVRLSSFDLLPINRTANSRKSGDYS